MIQDRELSPEAIKAAQTAEKLLRVAGRNPEEAAKYIAKAQEIMNEFNLDQAAIEEAKGDTGVRTDEKLKGGHFGFQRDLWKAVAELNFCYYMNITEVVRTYHMVVKDKAAPHRGFKRAVKSEKYVRTHRLIGRTHNVRMTKAQADYLESTAERLTREAVTERFHDQNYAKMFYSTWANSYREGITEAVCEKLYDRRREILKKERDEQEERLRAASKAGRESVSTGTAITLASFAQAERDENMEFLYPGYKQRQLEAEKEQREREQRMAQRRAEAEAAFAAWAAANPEAARLEAETARKLREEDRKREERNARRRTGPRYSRADEYKGDWGARRAGYEVGQRVSIDYQAEGRKSAGALG